MCSLGCSSFGCSVVRRRLTIALVERQRHYLRAHAPAPDVDLEVLARRASIRGQVRHADRLLEVRRLRAARDDAGLASVDVDLVAVARDRPVEHFEAGQLAADAFLLLS